MAASVERALSGGAVETVAELVAQDDVAHGLGVVAVLAVQGAEQVVDLGVGVVGRQLTLEDAAGRARLTALAEVVTHRRHEADGGAEDGVLVHDSSVRASNPYVQWIQAQSSMHYRHGYGRRRAALVCPGGRRRHR